MELLLIRHALPVRRELVIGAADPELSTAGRAQAEHLADYLAGEHLDGVYSQSAAARRRDRRPGCRPSRARAGHRRRRRRVGSHVTRLRSGRGAQGGRRPALAAPLVAGVWTSDESPGPVPRPRRGVRSSISSMPTPGGRIAVVCHGGVINSYLCRRAGPRSDASRLLLPELHVHPSRDGGRHRGAVDPDDQRDITPPRHRPTHRAAPDWLTMPGPHSLADLVSHLDALPHRSTPSIRSRPTRGGRLRARSRARRVGRRAGSRLHRP